MKKLLLMLALASLVSTSAVSSRAGDNDGHILIGGRTTPTPTPTPSPDAGDGHILIGGRAVENSNGDFSFWKFLQYFGF